MNKRKNVFLLLAAISMTASNAQTAADSLTIVSAQWQTTQVTEDVTGKCASFPSLYNGPQYISIVEIANHRKHPARIGTSERMKPLSELAQMKHAVAAINGSYYDMSNGNSVCFLKEGNAEADTTTEQEFKVRVTGAIRTTSKGKVKLLPWSAKAEKRYKKKRGSIVASGPLMLCKGHYSDWSDCDEDFINTKHPRSAIALTRDKRLLLITVDGRAKDHANGMSIPELAHLIKILGGKTAVNLDGGGSTTLYLDGKILNHPSDNGNFDHQGERSIPNFIYIAEKE